MLVGDIHLSDRPPSVRTESYADDILAKLRFASKQAALHKCDALVLAGDVFHSKIPSRTSHGLVVRAHAALTEGGRPVEIVGGNHDMRHDRLDSIPDQPLGSLCQMEGVHLLSGWHEELPLFGLPYLPNWGEALDEWMSKWSAPGAECLMVTHAPIFPPNEEPPYEYVRAVDWAMQMGSGACYYGHIHDPHGEYTVGAVHFCNNGAISRGSLHEKTLKRVPAITLYDDDPDLRYDQAFRRIEVPHLPAAEVFRLVDVAQKVEKQNRLDVFLEEIGQTNLSVSGSEELLGAIQQMGLRPDTLRAIQEVIEEVQT